MPANWQTGLPELQTTSIPANQQTGNLALDSNLIHLRIIYLIIFYDKQFDYRFKIPTVGRLAQCGAEHDAFDKHLGRWLTTSPSELPHREIATALLEKSEA
jgi:hypothetical protein